MNPFVEGQEYYSTLIHEMAHSTGAENRLNREMKGGKSTKDYAKEELGGRTYLCFHLSATGL